MTRIESPFQGSLHSCSLFSIALLSFLCDSPFRGQRVNTVDTSYDSPQFDRTEKCLNRENCPQEYSRQVRSLISDTVSSFRVQVFQSEVASLGSEEYLRLKSEEVSSVQGNRVSTVCPFPVVDVAQINDSVFTEKPRTDESYFVHAFRFSRALGRLEDRPFDTIKRRVRPELFGPAYSNILPCSHRLGLDEEGSFDIGPNSRTIINTLLFLPSLRFPWLLARASKTNTGPF